jgi:Mlc titration factor MtfA (ptsG expression regulator)
LQSKNKPKNKTQKPQTSVVARTKGSLAVLDKREKSINERIAKLQKRLDELSKLGKEDELKLKEMELLKLKQKQIITKKEALLTEIRSIVAAFSATVPAAETQS